MSEHTVPSLAQRMAAMQAQNVVTCSSCGGDYFSLLTYSQFQGGRYSSAVGGDLSAVPGPTFQMAVCLCGEPYNPTIGGARLSRTAGAEQDRFLKSLQKA